jgi:hypothetical protein
MAKLNLLEPQVDSTMDQARQKRCAMSALITLGEPTQPMLTEAAATGFDESKDFPGRYPRLQILTIAELLAGKKLEYPAHRYLRATRFRPKAGGLRTAPTRNPRSALRTPCPCFFRPWRGSGGVGGDFPTARKHRGKLRPGLRFSPVSLRATIMGKQARNSS